MKRNGPQRCWLIATAVFLIEFPSEVSAQAVTGGSGAEDPYGVVDQNSVNLITGMPSLVSRDLSIGDTGGSGQAPCWSDGGWSDRETGCTVSGRFRELRSNVERMDTSGLELTRYWNQSSVWQAGNTIYGWQTNWSSNLALEQGRFKVTVGNQSFNIYGPTFGYQSARGDGASLAPLGNNSYQLTTRDGAVILFPSVPSHYYSAPSMGPATQITYPNGRVINISYATRAGCGNPSCADLTYLRIQQISSSDNYGLLFEYPSDDGSADNLADWIQPSRITAFNRSIDNCGTTLMHCSFSRTWPAVTYTASATAMTTTSPGGRTTTYQLSGGKITRIIDPDGNIAQDIGYHSQSNPSLPNLVSSVTRGGSTWSYNPTPLVPWLPQLVVRTMTVTDPLGGVRVTKGNTKFGILEATDQLNRTTTYAYDDQTRLVTVTRPDGAYTTRTYDARGNITQVRQVATPGSGQADLVVSATFPATCTNPRTCNRPVTMTDARGFVTDYGFDPAHGGALTETGPAAPDGVRPQVRYGYTQGGGVYRLSESSSCQTLASCAGSADESRTILAYGTSNTLPTSITTTSGAGSPGATFSATYDDLGNVVTATDPLGSTEYLFYDLDRRVTGMIGADPDGGGPLPRRALRYSYNAGGQPTSIEQGTVIGTTSGALAAMAIVQNRSITYDSLGRKAREADEGGATPYTTAQYSYDVVGRPECTAIRMNPAAFASLPSSACALGLQGGDGVDRITRNVYDAAGQRLQLREGVGSADGGTEATWAYNLNSQVTTMIDGNGNRAEFRYDGHGRQDRWTFPSATGPAAFDDATPATSLATAGSTNAADYEEYGYDPNGNRTSLRKRDARRILHAYDALNRATSKTYPDGGARDVHYGYDLRGLQLSARFDSQAGEGVANVFDGFGRLGSSSTDLGGVTRTLAYAHDRNGNRTRITHPDGQWFATDHDALDRPIFLHGSGGGIGQSYYTPAGALSDLNRVGWTFSHIGYDALQRPNWRGHYFTGADNVHFSYGVAWSYAFNPAGQVGSVARDNDDFAWRRHYGVNRAYATNGLNQYTAAGPANFAYDPNGNLIADGTNTYGYDVENRMVAGPNGATLSYDPLGRLFQVTGGGNTTRFLYDGDALVAEYDGSNNMIRRHVHWVGQPAPAEAGVPLATYEGAGFGTLRQLFADHQGSIVALADTAGHVAAINTYDEYGIPGAGNVGRFQYTGQIWLPEIGMYYYKARIYSPTLGRFMQTDPVGYEDQFNLYAYVGNDPVNRTDPSGEGDHCSYTPGRCGERQITRAERQRQDEAYRSVGMAVATIIPAERAVAGAVWLGRAFLASRAASAGYRAAVAYINHQISWELNRGIRNGLVNAIRIQVQRGILVGGRDHIAKAHNALGWIRNTTRTINRSNLSSAEKTQLIDRLDRLRRQIEDALNSGNRVPR